MPSLEFRHATKSHLYDLLALRKVFGKHPEIDERIRKQIAQMDQDDVKVVMQAVNENLAD